VRARTCRKSDRLRATVRVCEQTRGRIRIVSVLTPAGPGAEPGHAKRLAQARLARRVRLEVVRLPARPGRRCVYGVRGGTRAGVDLAELFVYLTISAFLRKVGRSRAEQCRRRRMDGTHQKLARAARVHGGQHGAGDLHRQASVEVRTHISAWSAALRNFRRSWLRAHRYCFWRVRAGLCQQWSAMEWRGTNAPVPFRTSRGARQR
jgi:hypothetical protein